jgi:glycosyltransferase involved in cell wall biosynthesis
VTRSPQILDTLGAAGRRKVLEKLTWEVKARQILAVYNAVLSGEKELTFLDYDRQRIG